MISAAERGFSILSNITVGTRDTSSLQDYKMYRNICHVAIKENNFGVTNNNSFFAKIICGFGGIFSGFGGIIRGFGGIINCHLFENKRIE